MLLQDLKKILKENNFFLSKSLDQNFLYSDSILEREVEYAEINSEDKLLEIGPGIGTLTEKILKKTGNLAVIEIDPKFAPILNKNVEEVIIGDALKVEWPECNKIISNVPYSISSPLIFKILEQPIELAVLCLQKEFARRMVAEPGTKNYSRLSVNCAVRADIEFLETVPKGKFFPVPRVDSAFVRLRPKNIVLPRKFADITRAIFQHKNKKLRNSLMDSYHEIGTKEEVASFVKSLGEIAQTKVLNLSPEDIINISKKY